jgi:transcriptional regulator with XRE-family HTH domain
MDMKVDSAFIKAQREHRAWSQEHLAQVTGLGLRTIQRIESGGSASYESAQALAAVLGVAVADLRADEPTGPVLRINVPLRPLLGVLAAVVTGGALLVATRSFADQVLMDVSVALKTAIPGSTGVDLREWKTQFIVDEGTLVPNVNDMRLQELRFSIVPTLLPDGKILVEMQIFEQQGDAEVLVASPRLVTADGQEAAVVTGSDARSFRFGITPRRQPRPLL